MDAANTEFSAAMSDSLPTSGNYQLSEVGIEFQDGISVEEWTDLGHQIARAGRSLGFLIGDWINYGESRKDFGEKYSEALKATGLDYSTLKLYSRVARHIEMVTRVTQLSFEHHRKVAMLEPEEQKRWLKVASKAVEKGEPISTRRLAKSITLGRVAKDADMHTPQNDRGIDNVHPHVNRIVAFWGKMKRSGWLEQATPEMAETLLVDLKPVLDIAQELHDSLSEGGGQVSGSHGE